MTFKTHTEGGSWNGGGTEVPNCILAERNAITTAFNFMNTSALGAMSALGGRATALSGCLTGKTVSSMEIDCRGPGCTAGVFGNAPVGGNSINMCPSGLPPSGLQADTDVTVFHELIHSCGGLQIDAWSMENHFYVRHGTFNPGVATVDDFLSETSDVGGGLRAGTFVVWERASGRVFVKVESGGSWNSGPTISRGAELSVDQATYRRP